jgi:hypothetical protein
MPSSYRELPALPVVAALAVVALAAMLWRLHRRAALNIPRVVVSAVLCVYGAGMVANSALPIYLGKPGSGMPWWSDLNLVPFRNTEMVDMLENVMVFAPLGFLVPLVLRVKSPRRVLLYAFLTSFAMEVLQFVNARTVHGGHVADINDLWANTVGALVGYGVLRAALLLPLVRRWASAATWPNSDREHTKTP